MRRYLAMAVTAGVAWCAVMASTGMAWRQRFLGRESDDRTSAPALGRFA